MLTTTPLTLTALAAATAAVSATSSLQDAQFFLARRQAAGSVGQTVMNLTMLTDSASTGALCLDGTPAGFYFSPATNPANKNDWQIYFEGGGWCYDEIDCYGRSSTNLGSSTDWPTTQTLGGLLDSDCSKNPDFCNFNRVFMPYCDGNSFSGNREEAVMVKGKPLYFRGRRILDSIMRTLAKDFDLDSAENVLLTGCSAGGLATYLHTDYVHDVLAKKIAPQTLKKFKSAPISGFFLQHNTEEGEPVYPTEMKTIFQLANSTNGLNSKCIDSFAAEDRWQCNFAQHAYANTESDIFPLNSALDAWQVPCIYTSVLPDGFPDQTDPSENGLCNHLPGWKSCVQSPENCNQTEIKSFNSYIGDFSSIITTAGSTYNRAGNGAFIHSCYMHCEAQSDSFFSITVNGVSMQQAVSKWWNSNGSDPAKDHSYSPCSYNDGPTGPRKCNPTCP